MEEGKRSGAHRGCDGGLGELGEAPEPTNLMKMAGGPEVEDDGDDGDAGLPEGCGSVGGGKRGSRRSSQAWRGVEGETVAAVVLVDGGRRIR